MSNLAAGSIINAKRKRKDPRKNLKSQEMCTQTETYSGVLERLRKTGTYHLGVNTYEYVARLKLSYTSMATPGEVGAAIANACEGRGEYAIHPIHREVRG